MRASCTLCLLALAEAASAQLTVVAVDPALNASNRAPNSSIRVDFDRPVDALSLAEFRVTGSVGGPIEGALSLENSDRRIRFDPARAFGAGELVTLTISGRLRAQDSSMLRDAGFVASFRVLAASAPMSFSQIASLHLSPASFPRIQSSQTCDLDGDDFADLAVVSANSADVRVFLNGADGTGAFQSPSMPVNATGSMPGPSASADVNGDGVLDLVTCNVGGSSASLLFGRGDGTFEPAVTYSMGLEPRGLALLDVDGDGDLDLVSADFAANDLALRRNNGNGTLGAPSFFEAGVDGEWGLAAADLDGDGIVDLVAGGRLDGNLAVLLSRGDGTFQAPIVSAAGGSVRMITCGDVNGDGRLDVTTANGSSGNGSILLGNGDGSLQSAALHAAGGQALATDLGDLDGDGDLDWVLSSSGGGQYVVFENDGSGVFALHTTIPADSNPAGCAIFDVDGDRDLDLALLDEIAGTCRILENGALEQLVFCAGDGSGAACPCGNRGARGHGCEHSFGTGGGLVLAQGDASVAADTLVLHASGLPPTASVVFFQGFAPQAIGSGTPFGDGLRCVASPNLRLGLRVASNGFARFGAGVGSDPPVSVKGQIPPAGGTFYYQGWFRNPQSFCTATTFNLTNGVRITWTP